MEFEIGKHCSEPTCKQLDFLPFKCRGCQKIFCLDHRTFESHSCTCVNPLKDRRALDCPLCGAVITSPPNQDPNIKMNDHLTQECKVMNPKLNQKKSTHNQCGVAGCKKREILPVTCSKCSQHFCLSHRWEKDHNCPSLQRKARILHQEGPFRISQKTYA